jgi:Zn-finger protein
MFIGCEVSRNYTPCPFSYSVPIFYFCPISPLVRYTTVFNFYKK